MRSQQPDHDFSSADQPGESRRTTSRRAGLSLFIASALWLSACATQRQALTTKRVIDGQVESTPYVSPHGYEHYLRARLALERNQLHLAIDALHRALAFDGDSPYLHAQLAEVAQRAGRAALRDQHVSRALALDPSFPEALLIEAEVLTQRGDRTGAERVLRRCIAAHPNLARAYRELASLLERDGRVHQARAVLQALVSRDARGAGLWELGQLCLRTIDLRCAASAYRQLQQQREDVQSLLLLAHVERALGRLEQARDLLAKALVQTGGDLGVAERLLSVLSQLGQRSTMAEVVETLGRQARGEARQAGELAQLALVHGFPARALTLATAFSDDLGGPPKSVKGSSQAPLELRLVEARALHAIGQRQRALRLLRRMMTSASEVRVALTRAALLREDGHLDQAASVLEGVLAQRPDDAQVILALAQVVELQGNTARSLTLLRDGRDRARDTELLLAYAASFERLGAWRTALEIAESLRDSARFEAPAHNFIGFILVNQNSELARAERAIHRALSLQPAEGYILDSLGWLRFKQGQVAQALELLTIAARLDPQQPEVLAHLAEVHAALSNFARATDLLRSAISLSQDGRLAARWVTRLDELQSKMIVTQPAPGLSATRVSSEQGAIDNLPAPGPRGRDQRARR